MLSFIARRLGLLIPTFFGVTLLTFALIRLIPGDPVEVMMGERRVDPEMHAEAMHRLGLDKPLPAQYLDYIGKLAHGDLGGLQVAYQAWRLAVGDTDPEPVDGIPANQRLFFGWAQTWRTILRPQAQKERLATDPHSPDEIRCNQTVRNINEFHDAFGTTPGDALWLEPSERVRIW